MRLTKLIVGTALLAWAALLLLARLNPTAQPTVTTSSYVELAVLLTPLVFVVVGLSLIVSARRTKKP